MVVASTILVDAGEFVESLARDVQDARDTVYCQMMTFEADVAGRGLVEMLRGCGAADRRMLVDSYVRAMISDRLIYAPRALFDRELRREARETWRLLAELPAEGIRTQYTNPVGFMLRRIARRNHKKLFLVDDRVSYLGGINVSDHNYRWHDVMVRIESREITSFLREDFLRSWGGGSQAGCFEFGDYSLYLLDGRTNAEIFGALLGLLDTASTRIWVETPYVTFPVFERLRRATSRGVDVEMVAPLENNKPLFDAYTRWEARRSGIQLRCLPVMTHVKAMLLDDHTLVLGSSNFDYLSYHVQQELFVVIRDPAVVRSFVERVVEPDQRRSVETAPGGSGVAGPLAYGLLRSALAASRVISAGAGWPSGTSSLIDYS